MKARTSGSADKLKGQRRTIRIAFARGAGVQRKEVSAEVYGQWAIHGKRPYTISHVPTGRRAATCVSVFVARRAAKGLLTAGIPRFRTMPEGRRLKVPAQIRDVLKAAGVEIPRI